LYVLGTTLAIQFVGAALLWLRWWPRLGAAHAAYLALFHAVSAFCNAGFDLFAGTGTVLFSFNNDPFTLGVLMTLIILGGLGILVVSDLVTFPKDRRLSVHTKVTLVLSVLLTVVGVVFAEEGFGDTSLGHLSLASRFQQVVFTVVSARTAGFTIVPIDQLSQASMLTLMSLMFIGGAPASMAGGVTLSTVAVLAVAVLSTVRGLPQAVVFGRVLPFETIAKAVAIMTISTLLCFGATLALLANTDNSLLLVAFEVISAFSNTGYSLGLTGDLSGFGRIMICIMMFWGRLGPLTIVVLLAQRQRPTFARYPAEPIVMG
jgi:trk system potassium uptake protein TrkH